MFTAHRLPKGPKNAVFSPGDQTFDLDCKLIGARDQTHLLCEFGANPSSGSIYFIHKQKTQTDGAKNRTFRSSLHAVITLNKRTVVTE